MPCQNSVLLQQNYKTPWLTQVGETSSTPATESPYVEITTVIFYLLLWRIVIHIVRREELVHVRNIGAASHSTGSGP